MRTTNVEFVTELMEHSRHGALIQAFVLEALYHYAEAVDRAPPGDLRTPMISEHAWKGCAAEIKAKLDERFEVT